MRLIGPPPIHGGILAPAVPLTFAHPLAAVPFRRLRLPLSALVVGSMSPDFIYFLRLEPGGDFGHTLPGLFLWDLPLSLGVLWVFHRWIAGPLVELGPRAVQERLVPILRRFRGRIVPIVAAVLVGAMTHIAWDGFTHGDGWAVERWPWWRQAVDLGPFGRVWLFKALQHGSTVVGVLGLAAWAGLWLRRAEAVPVEPRLATPERLRRVLVLIGGALAFGVAYAVVGAAQDPEDALRIFAGRAVVATTTAAFVLAAAYGAWTTRRAARR